MNFIQKKYFQNLRVNGNFIYSYETKVAKIDWNRENVVILGYWSQTTSKHINYVAKELNFLVSIDTTKTYKIEFQDKDKNELFISIVDAVDLEDATNFANKMFAETRCNDLFTFVITEA
jgi:hypothetical protein